MKAEDCYKGRKPKSSREAGGTQSLRSANTSFKGAAPPPKGHYDVDDRHPTYRRIRNEIEELEAKAKQTRFRKQIDIRTFVYHIA